MEFTIKNYLASIPIFTGLLLLAVGTLLNRFPPKSINFLLGYRTSRSMQSQTAWDFAQKYWGGTIIKFGLVLIVIGIGGIVIGNIGLAGLLLGFIIFISFVAISIAMTEKKLANMFSNNSNTNRSGTMSSGQT